MVTPDHGGPLIDGFWLDYINNETKNKVRQLNFQLKIDIPNHWKITDVNTMPERYPASVIPKLTMKLLMLYETAVKKGMIP